MTIHRFALLAFAACTSFEPIERGVCGNGLIEPGEDCDSEDPSCVACAVVCRAATDCPTSSYACGVDGLCHAPSGVLSSATTPALMLVDDLRITDIDRDGIGDVLGASHTSLEVRFGDPRGSLTSSFTMATPTQTGPVTFDDLDGDGAVDATFATPDGIVAYTSPYGVLSPAVSFVPVTTAGSTMLRALFPVQGATFGLIVEDAASGSLFVEIYSFSTPPTGEAFAFCALPAADFTPDSLDVYEVSGTNSPTDPIDIAVTALTNGASGRHLCALAIHLDPTASNGARGPHFFDITPTGPAPMRRPVWADLDLDTDPCPSLVDSDGGGAALRAWDGSMASDHCTLAASSAALPPIADAGADAAAVGHVPVSPPIPHVAADALVLTTGFYLLNASSAGLGPEAFTTIYQAGRTISHVAFGDLDGDGATDAALAGRNDNDVDIVYRAQNAGSPGFVIDRLDTAGVVDALVIADYDGNGLGDVGYIEQMLGHETLAVSYSQPGRNEITLTEGAFASVASAIPFQIPDTSDPFELVGDMMILEQLPSDSSWGLTLLHGSPQRTMLSYFEPRASNDPLRQASIRNTVAGHFESSSMSTPYLDLLALTPTGTASPTASGYLLDGTANGLDPSDPINAAFGESITGLADCAGGSAAAPCVDDASLIAWHGSAARDTVVGIDHQHPPNGFVFDPWRFGAGAANTIPATVVSAPTRAVPAGAVIHASYAIDLDGDGQPELVLAFAPAETASAADPGLVEACTMSAAGVPTACVDLGAVVAQVVPGASCVDAAPGRMRASAPTSPPVAAAELVALCHDQTGDSLLARVSLDAGAYHAELIATGLGAIRAIAVGDVTGDGVDDVVTIRGDVGERSVAVLAQCSSRDLACQASGGAP